MNIAFIETHARNRSQFGTLSTGNPQVVNSGSRTIEKQSMLVMIASMLTLLFLTAASWVGAATFVTVKQFGRQALGLRSQLAATSPTRALTFNVVEHRVMRGGINVAILPVQKCAQRLLSIEGLRAAA